MRVLVLCVLLGSVVAAEVHAQGPEQGGINPAQTRKVVSALENMFEACRTVAVPYLPDCVSRALQRGAGKIAKNPGYWEAHVALIRAERTLMRVVRENADPEAGSVRVEGYRLKAVMTSALPSLRQVGEEVFARAERDLGMLEPYERDGFAPITTVIQTRRPWP